MVKISTHAFVAFPASAIEEAQMQARGIVAEAWPRILEAHGCMSWPELELKMAEQVLAERLADGDNS